MVSMVLDSSRSIVGIQSAAAQQPLAHRLLLRSVGYACFTSNVMGRDGCFARTAAAGEAERWAARTRPGLGIIYD